MIDKFHSLLFITYWELLGKQTWAIA